MTRDGKTVTPFVGWCVKHDSMAMLYDDGSVDCHYLAIVEMYSNECTVEPISPERLYLGQPLPSPEQEFRLCATKRLPLVGDSRHEEVRAIGTYEYVKDGIQFTARNGEVQTFLYPEWDVFVTALIGSTHADRER